MTGLWRAGVVLLAVFAFQPPGPSPAADCSQPPADLPSIVRSIRDTIRREYAAPPRFTYIENRRDIDVSNLGGVSVGPMRTFEVYPTADNDEYKRLIAIDGKPLDAAELARRDAEHERHEQKRAERDRTETPQRRAARLKKAADEARERDDILDDAAAVFEFRFVCREVLEGESVLVLSMTARPEARVKTREGGWMKRFAGRIWVAERGHHIARVRLHAKDDVSVGWGVVARVDPGSGFDYVRKRVGDSWLPSVLTIEGSGRTLLFRRFQVKTVTTYTKHQPYDGTGS
jgi:hypothetical protein